MVSVACVGVRISMMFHLMFVHNTLSSVWVVGHFWEIAALSVCNLFSLSYFYM